MTHYLALLRAVNVGGTGKLPMKELKAMCEAAGFTDVRTCIASGNVLFTSKLGEPLVQKKLAQRLHDHAGKPVGVLIRSAAEITRVLADNPFPDAPRNRVVAIFLDTAPPANALDDIRHQKREQLACGKREIYVHYRDGMADSRLIIPAARTGTARNINTVAKLAELAAASHARATSASRKLSLTRMAPE
ncbi:MAG: DUF1697 domain-containing protein [Rhodanobacter sp.]